MVASSRTIATSFNRPHVSWGLWIVLLGLAIMSIVVYAGDILCNDMKYLCGSIFFLFAIISTVLLVYYAPIFKHTKSCLSVLLKTAVGKVGLISTIISSHNTLHLYFWLMGISILVISLILGSMCFAGAGCVTAEDECTTKSLQLASTYTGSMVACVILALFFGILVIQRVLRYYGDHNEQELYDTITISTSTLTPPSQN